ncbi:MAG: hypothetical protein COB93_01460, partial [Sneathiella sp.]
MFPMTNAKPSQMGHPSPAESQCSHFLITADIEPSVATRILNHFALRNLVPDHVEIRKTQTEL